MSVLWRVPDCTETKVKRVFSLGMAPQKDGA